MDLLIALVEAVEASAAWHRAQEFRAQAKAAADAAVLGTGPKSRTGRVTRTAGRGLLTAGPVTGVPARLQPGQSPPDRPGPARTR
ncbi:hypothetical protein [Streptomyces virginiae]|uniref:hypothetical protein n=1 Tax=Streptomyces virginiae TaxID=1961 RepID=UPI00224E21A5|nr:hypothetical protein [Streptomyces virginiae]MCX5174091.1 hypothetical protein [Streptomyces virginiae]